MLGRISGREDARALLVRHLRIAPDHQHGVAAQFVVAGQEVGQDADRLEAVAHLEADHRIALLAFLDQFQVALRRTHRPRAPRIVRHPAAEDDALEPQMLAQLAPLVVEPLADALAAQAGIDDHVHAVEPVALGIVAGGIAAPGDGRPVVRRHRHVGGNAKRRAVADDPALEHRHELAFGKLVQMPAQLRRRVGAGLAERGIDAAA